MIYYLKILAWIMWIFNCMVLRKKSQLQASNFCQLKLPFGILNSVISSADRIWLISAPLISCCNCEDWSFNPESNWENAAEIREVLCLIWVYNHKRASCTSNSKRERKYIKGFHRWTFQSCFIFSTWRIWGSFIQYPLFPFFIFIDIEKERYI